jgi:hypothetical protein
MYRLGIEIAVLCVLLIALVTSCGITDKWVIREEVDSRPKFIHVTCQGGYEGMAYSASTDSNGTIIMLSNRVIIRYSPTVACQIIEAYEPPVQDDPAKKKPQGTQANAR